MEYVNGAAHNSVYQAPGLTIASTIVPGPWLASGHSSHEPNAGAPAPGPRLQNDPLAGLTKKQIWIDCVWISDESTAAKIFLLCIGRFFDKEAQSSSMSYGQIARECSLHEATSKKIARAAAGYDLGDKPATKRVWLRIEKCAGFKSSSGPQNLYHAEAPPDLTERLRELRRSGATPQQDQDIAAAVKGAASDYPLPEEGVAQNDLLNRKGSPQTTPSPQRGSLGLSKGSPQATRTPKGTPKEEEQRERAEGAPAPTDEPSRSADKGTRLPDDWMLPNIWRAAVRDRLGLSDAQVDTEARKFRTHWTTKTGRDATKRNWSLVWDNWVDNAVEKGWLKPTAPPQRLDLRNAHLLDLDAEVARVAATREGRATLAEMGRERGLQYIRDMLVRQQAGACG